MLLPLSELVFLPSVHMKAQPLLQNHSQASTKSSGNPLARAWL